MRHQYGENNQRNRMRKMLAPLPRDVIDKFKYDEEASWSFTDLKIGLALARRILKLPGITSESVIFDATASVGGNTIAFAKYFNCVHSCELNPARKTMLDDNLTLLGYNNVITHIGYAQEYLSAIDYDVVFFDPPWGVDYKKHTKLRITMSDGNEDQSFESIVKQAAQVAKYIVVKLPQNYDLEFFSNALHGIIEIIHKEWHGRPNTSLFMICRVI